MKKTIFKTALCLLFIAPVIYLASCKKAIDIGSPPTMITPDKVFESDASATAAALGNYTSLATFDANFVPNLALYTDELNENTLDGTSAEFASGKLTITNGGVANCWQAMYVTIYKANANIAGLEPATKLSDGTRKQLLGESLFTRAYCYFNLTNLFGAVPLLTSTEVSTSANAARSPSSAIYAQVVADLTEAKNLLGTAYPTGEKIRPNTFAASALLARVYLAGQEWQKAADEASAVISSGIYSLSPIEKVFQKNSSEAIWQLWNQTGYTSLSILVPPDSGDPAYVLSPRLDEALEAGDQRRTRWTKTVSSSGQTFIAPYKYKVNVPAAGDDGEYTMYLRLAELYLVRAEAEARLGSDLNAAAADVDVIRKRAGLSGLPEGLPAAALLTAIAHERQSEFFAEAGLRFFDLKRRGEINQVISPLKPAWDNTRSPLFPVPQAQRIINRNLSQNPGY